MLNLWEKKTRSLHVAAFFEKQHFFAAFILGFAIIGIFLLSDFKANVDDKPRTPICFENQISYPMS